MAQLARASDWTDAHATFYGGSDASGTMGFRGHSRSSFQHFSHPHCLEMTNMIGGGGGGGEHFCRGCFKSVSNGLVYHCKPCNFYLHLSCSEIPHQINHPVDNHVLSLLSHPRDYGRNMICRCNACGQDMRHGFSFHCRNCHLDLHPSCANLPMKFHHQDHPHHTLTLSFTPPYPSRAFICNVCKKKGENSWHYHCSQCSFDVHVTCTQISSMRERVINQFLHNYSEGVMGMGSHIPTTNPPSHLGRTRSYSEPTRFSPLPRPSMYTNSSSFHVHHHQQQQPTYVNMNFSMFVRQGVEAIVRVGMGPAMQNAMGDAMGSGIPGGDYPGIFGVVNSLGDLSGIIGSLFGFGFF